jgi:quercetin dioxygenase-like cupin family protein
VKLETCLAEGKMKLFKSGEYVELRNPNSNKPYRPEILTLQNGAKNLGGMFGLLPPGSQVPYHSRVNRESVIIIIAGEATEVIEGEEIAIKAGDVLYIPAGEKHQTVNRSAGDFRYLEFYTCPPMGADFVEVK